MAGQVPESGWPPVQTSLALGATSVTEAQHMGTEHTDLSSQGGSVRQTKEARQRKERKLWYKEI